MTIDNIQATNRIYCLMREIRDTIYNMDPETDDPYLSLFIQIDGTIKFNNTYWDLPFEKQINFREDVEVVRNE